MEADVGTATAPAQVLPGPEEADASQVDGETQATDANCGNQTVVIVGGGIIGACTAYYLAKKQKHTVRLNGGRWELDHYESDALRVNSVTCATA